MEECREESCVNHPISLEEFVETASTNAICVLVSSLSLFSEIR